MGMGRLRQLAANEVAPEEKPHCQDQLLLHIDFILVGGQLDKAVPSRRGLVWRRAVDDFHGNRLRNSILEGECRNGQFAGGFRCQLVGPGDFTHHLTVYGADTVLLVLGQDLKIGFHFLDIRLGQARHVEVEQVAKIDVYLHAAFYGQGQNLTLIEAGPVRLDCQLPGLCMGLCLGRQPECRQKKQTDGGNHQPFYHGVSPSSDGVWRC